MTIIPFFSGPYIDITNPDYVDILTQGKIGTGEYVRKFERALQKTLPAGLRVIATSSGTTALLAVFAALRMLKGARLRIGVPAYGYQAAANVALLTDNEIVAMPCGENGCAKPASEQIEMLDALVYVHFNGIVTPDAVDAARRCRKAGVIFIEDAACAFGNSLTITDSLPGEYAAGTIGDIAIFSFGSTKFVTCGQGGAIAVPYESPLSIYAGQAVKQGTAGDRHAHCFGLNGKLSDINAAIGLSSLAGVDETKAARHAIFKTISEAANNWWRPYIDLAGLEQVPNYNIVRCASREVAIELIRHLDGRYIESKMLHRTLHRHPLFVRELVGGAPCPISESLADTLVYLPYGTIRERKGNRLIEALREFK